GARSRSRSKKPPLSPTVDEVEAFDLLWDAYALKVGRKDGLTVFIQKRRAGALPDFQTLINSARVYAAYVRERQIGQKHLSTWLNCDGWLDEPPPIRAPARNGRAAGPQSGPGIFDQVTSGGF